MGSTAPPFRFPMPVALAPDSWSPARQGVAHYFDGLPGPAWIKDESRRYVYANAAAERAFGITRNALYGRTDGDVFPAASARVSPRQDERVLATRQPLQSIDELE